MSRRLRDYQAKLDELKLPIESLRKDTERAGYSIAELNSYFVKITHGRNLNWYISATDPEVCLLSNDSNDPNDPYRGVLLQ